MTTEVISTESKNHSYSASISLDNSGNLHVVWEDLTDYGGSGTDSDIFYKRWKVTTDDWTATEVVSTESTNHSYIASIAVHVLHLG